MKNIKTFKAAFASKARPVLDSNIMDAAAAIGHLAIVIWLNDHQCQALYLNQDQPWKPVVDLVWGNAFGTVELLLSRIQMNEEESHFLDFQ